MKRILLFLVCSLTLGALSATESGKGQGASYYNAGFPQVAKPLLLNEYKSNPANSSEVCYYLGNIYFEENNLDSAAYYFNIGTSAQPVSTLNTVGLIMMKMKSDMPGAENEIKNLLKIKGNKKNEALLISISRAYLVNGKLDKATEFQSMVKSLKPKSANGAVLLGDIRLAKNELGPACGSYETAILYDENCKEAYIKYARAYKNANPKLAISMLERLKQNQPDFLLADRELADIYYAQNNFEKAAELYEVYLKSGNSNVQDLTKYALTLFLNKNFEKSLEVANMGLQKAPRNPALNRLAMWNNIDLKRFEEGLKAADKFFNQTDKPDFTYLDYRYYGQALRETKQFDLSIQQFEIALKMDSTKTELWKDISDMYSDKGDLQNSINTYIKYMNSLSDDKKTADVKIALGKLYYSLGNSKDAGQDIKTNALLKADTIFAQVFSIEPTVYRGVFWRARTNSVLDPETSKGLAKPYYEQTVAIVEPKADSRYNSVLIECYSYLGYYFILQNDNLNSLAYWNKIIAIDPNNATAKKAMDGIQKVLNKTKK
ncbi:MAG TPA: tetratricopeptide repeat protein [Paludibacter sp.]|nr:tetratricopeptide repeat protein [Paludibacter sp.]